MNHLDELWAVLWSRQQACLHYERLSETTKTSLSMLKGELSPNDYILLWVGPESAVDEVLDLARPFVKAREIADAALGLRDK